MSLRLGASLKTDNSEEFQSTAIDHLRQLETAHGRSLFARGYFLSARGQTAYIPTSWIKRSALRLELHHDPRVSFSSASGKDGELFLLGEVMSIEAPRSTNQDIADLLVATGFHGSFFDQIDKMHGRFLLAYRPRGGEVRLLSDATGMRTVFHATTGGTAGSHAYLLAANLGSSRLGVPRSRFGWPGRSTPYRNIVLLPPNSSVRLSDGQVERFYPRGPLPSLSTDNVAAAASEYLTATLVGLRNRFKPPLAVSLTAGLDSRTTLAVAREDHADLLFFTYFRDQQTQTDAVDRAVASLLARRFGLRHWMLELEPNAESLSEDAGALYRALSYYPHLHAAVPRYMTDLAPIVDVHIRSNLSEIGRSFYSYAKNIGPMNPTGHELGAAYLAFAKKTVTPEDRRRIGRIFEDFVRVTDFTSASQFLDARDLLYWEHRMGAWHSLAILESDPAFDSMSLFNSRVVLETFLSAALEDRTKGLAMKRTISYLWNDLLDIPINPKRSWIQRSE